MSRPFQSGAAKGAGVSIAFPDVCKTPPTPGGPVPVPYPHINQLSEASVETKKVKAAAREVLTNRAQYRLASGDEAGTLKGLNALQPMGKSYIQSPAMDVKVEGKQVSRMGTSMFLHQSSSPKKGAGAQMAAPASVMVTLQDVDELLEEHKKKIANPGDYSYDDAKKVQAEFEQNLERLLNRLTMSPQATPALQVMVNDLSLAVIAAAKGEGK